MAVVLNLYPLLTPCGTISALIAVVITRWAGLSVIDAVVSLHPPNDFFQRPPRSKVLFDVVIRHWCVHRFLTK